MLEELARVLADVFPSIEPETARRFIEAAKNRVPLASELYTAQPLPGINQADIIGPLPFCAVDQDGEGIRAESLGLVLSHSCDVEHDEQLLAAFGFPLVELRASVGSEGEGFIRSIARNTKYHLYYLPAVPGNSDLVFDLSRVGTFSGKFIQRRLDDGGIRRFASMSQFGFYLFVAKLTLHLLRPETEATRPEAPGLPLSHRIRTAFRVLMGSY